MKAITFYRYGTTEVLNHEEIPTPEPGPGEVLVKVHFASINSWDWDLIKGIPFANRAMFGLRRPKIQVPGLDMSGVVEVAGEGTTHFKKGDAVYGDLSDAGMGAFAEYVCVKQEALSVKPDFLDFKKAAATPHTGSLAWQGLVDKAELKKGQTVLINGAGGGSGTFGLQIAKNLGAEVTVVDSADKLPMLKQLGADETIDFTTQDFAKLGPKFDVILDVITYRSIWAYKRALAPGGTYVMLGGGNYHKVFKAFFMGPLLSLTRKRKMGVLMHKANGGLSNLEGMMEKGELTPIIDRVFPLAETAQAFEYYGAGRAQGKVVIDMGVN